MRTILVYAGSEEGGIARDTPELVRVARELADARNGRVEVLVLAGDGDLPDLAISGCDVVVIARHPLLAQYVPEAHALALREAITSRRPEVVLLATSVAGLDIAAWVAAAIDWPVVEHCTEVWADDTSVYAKSEVFDGRLLATTKTAPPVILAIEPRSDGNRTRAHGDPTVVDLRLPADIDRLRSRMKAAFTGGSDDAAIEQAERIVCIGRGIGSRDNVPAAAALAAALGAELAGSRPIVDAGWLPRSRQVGLSGAIVSPSVYLALGISGAFQHVTGMRGAKLVIAVNKDRSAPIFEVADYGATVDVLALIPALERKLRPSSAAE